MDFSFLDAAKAKLGGLLAKGKSLAGHGRPALFQVASTSQTGLVRTDNQDHVLVAPEAGILAVADGMGGGAEGSTASKWVCDALEDVAKSRVELSLAERQELVGQMLKRANRKILQHAQARGYRVMGSTVAFLLVDLKDTARGRVCHAGDSRVYRYRNGLLEALTFDHTVGSELSRAAGKVAGGESFGSRQNPLSHVLTRAIGTEDLFRLEWEDVDFQHGDRFLLCSDGVHDVLEDCDLASLLPGGTPEAAVARLTQEVLARGAPDNFSIIVADSEAKRAKA